MANVDLYDCGEFEGYGSSGSGKEVDPIITNPYDEDPNNVPSESNEGQETPAP